MDMLTSLDPTAVCITLLIAALTLLWLYVSMTGARREQPNLSALYEQTSLRPSAVGQSRSPRVTAGTKGKGKSKQVEGSPRSSLQKTTTNEAAAVSSERATLPIQQAAQTGKASLDAPASKPTAGNKGKKNKKRPAFQASETADGAQKPQLEEGEGEWKMQLSRQQLKALRKKQKKEKEKKKAETEEVSKSSSSDTDSKQVSTATLSSSDNGGYNKRVQKKEREAKESSKLKEVSEERAGKIDGNQSGNGSSNGQKATENSEAGSVTAKSSQKDPESTEEQQPQQLVEKEEEKASSLAEPTVSSGAAVSACVSDVEEALKEAARSSPEDNNQLAETEAPFTEVKSKSHRQQKASEESSRPLDPTTPGPVDTEHDEEWVVIEGTGDSLT